MVRAIAVSLAVLVLSNSIVCGSDDAASGSIAELVEGLKTASNETYLACYTKLETRLRSHGVSEQDIVSVANLLEQDQERLVRSGVSLLADMQRSPGLLAIVDTLGRARPLTQRWILEAYQIPTQGGIVHDQPSDPAVVRFIAELGKLIESRDALVRVIATVRLAESGTSDPRILPVLLDSLAWQSRDISVRSNDVWGWAVVGLGHVRGDPEQERAISTLIEILGDAERPYLHATAARALSCHGSKAAAAVPVLMEGLKSSSAPTRDTCAFALAMIGPAAAPALPMLQELQNDPSASVRRSATLAIKKAGGKWVGEGTTVRELAANPHPDGIPILVQAIEQGGAEDAKLAVSALIKLTPMSDQIIAGLIAAAGRPEPAVHLFAAAQLRKLGDAAVPALTAAMEAERVGTRVAAVTTLGQIRPQTSAIQALLRKSLHDPDFAVWDAARAALNIQSPPRSAPPDPITFGKPASDWTALLREQHDQGAITALHAVRELYPPMAETLGQALLRATEQELSVDMILLTLRGMRQAGAPALDDILRALAQTARQPEVQNNDQANILARRKYELILTAGYVAPTDERVAKLLADCLKGSSDYLCRNIAVFLAYRAAAVPSEATLPSQALLGHQDPVVRASAAGILGRLKAKSALPALRKATGDPSSAVSDAAKRAIAMIELTADEYLASKLSASRISGSFQQQRLKNILEYVHNVASVDIDTRWEELASIGVTSDTPVTLTVSNSTVEVALKAILDHVTPAGCRTPPRWRMVGGRVVIGVRGGQEPDGSSAVVPTAQAVKLHPLPEMDVNGRSPKQWLETLAQPGNRSERFKAIAAVAKMARTSSDSGLPSESINSLIHHCVAALSRAAEDVDQAVAGNAIIALGNLGAAAQPAMPVLQRHASGKGPLKPYADAAIQKIQRASQSR